MNFPNWLWLLIIILGFLWLLKPSQSENYSNSLNESQWKVKEIKNQEITNNNPTMEFIQENQNLRFSGFAGCNRYFGTISFPLESESRENNSTLPIKFSPTGNTLMACPDEQMNLERQFLQSLEEIFYYQINGQQLIMLDANQDPIIILSRL